MRKFAVVYVLLILLITTFNVSYIIVSTVFMNKTMIHKVAWDSLDEKRKEQVILNKEKQDVQLIKSDKVSEDKNLKVKDSFNYRISALNGGYLAKVTFKIDEKNTFYIYVNPFTKKVVATLN